MKRGHAKSRLIGRSAIPPVWLMTDERIEEADLLRAVSRLPWGSVIVLRHYGLSQRDRRHLFIRLRERGRSRHLKILVAGDPALARSWDADGHHGRAPAGLRQRDWLHSAPVHNMRELRDAERSGADVLMISPLFPTRSHPGSASLGVGRFAALVRAATVPVLALGGIHPRHAHLVRQLGAQGFAAIDGLVDRRSRAAALRI
jgi:thiamine-phosphate pyrophosphorylase